MFMHAALGVTSSSAALRASARSRADLTGSADSGAVTRT